MREVIVSAPAESRPIWCVTKTGFAEASLPEPARRFARSAGFEAAAGKHLLVPDADGTLAGVLFGLAEGGDPFALGVLPAILPAGTYRLEGALENPRLAALGFALGAYRFTRYRKATERGVRLALPPGVDADGLSRTIAAVELVRDLVNTPANDLGPAEIEAAARALAAAHGARVRVIRGEELLAQNLPMIHAVGRASASAPRLIELTAGEAGLPKVTLVGKGVAFDTGGLDIKPSSAMLLMKKDMGGAACALGLAHLLLARRARVRLKVLIPAVENSISGSAFRPGDVLASRKGLTVEIGNTDAEGRLVLADALTLACEEEPDLLIDFATLTGAARVALGPQLPAAFTHDEALAADLARHAQAEADPLWRLPLWKPYAAMLDSKVADTSNVSSGGLAGAITAALFLEKFAAPAGSWLHLDLFAWNPSTRPGRPEGGEAQTIRALDTLIAERYGATR
ncbi:leucyl aminopeptidase family protein [Xanthobacter sp. KR7-225]|uniref:leucyl aminopeptidase family protein n=1 Tax=Xanthobacter sp. KR7-225 TaxID=3156613 RepID=UPI0032B33284